MAQSLLKSARLTCTDAAQGRGIGQEATVLHPLNPLVLISVTSLAAGACNAASQWRCSGTGTAVSSWGA